MSFSGTKGYLTKPKPGIMLNPLHPLSKGLVGYWLFNEGAGSLANDISGYKNHGRLTNITPNVQGSGWGGSKFGGGLEFDGVDDYVDCGNDSSLDITSNGTIDIRFKFSEIPSSYNGFLAHKIGSWNTGTGFELYYNSGVNRFEFVTSGSDYGYSDAIVDDDNWHQIIVVINGTTCAFYLDSHDITSDSSITAIPSNSSSFIIGKRISLPHIFKGSICSVNIYNRALSPEEITWLYREPYAMFEPAFNPSILYSPPVGAIINQFQRANIGADLYNGVFA